MNMRPKVGSDANTKLGLLVLANSPMCFKDGSGIIDGGRGLNYLSPVCLTIAKDISGTSYLSIAKNMDKW